LPIFIKLPAVIDNGFDRSLEQGWCRVEKHFVKWPEVQRIWLPYWVPRHEPSDARVDESEIKLAHRVAPDMAVGL